MNIHISYRVRGPSIIPAVLALVLSAGCSGDRPEFGPIQAPESDAGGSGDGTSSTSNPSGEGGATDDSSPSDTTTTSSTGEGSGKDGPDGETTSNGDDVDDTSDSDTKEPSGGSDTDSDTADTNTDTDASDTETETDTAETETETDTAETETETGTADTDTEEPDANTDTSDTDTEEQDASTAPDNTDDTSTLECEPDTTRSCSEDGAQGTCGTGIQTCGEDGTWGDCSIVPAAEDTCEPGNDDGARCGDGAIDENESCDEGEGAASGGCVDCEIVEGWECDGEPSACVAIEAPVIQSFLTSAVSVPGGGGKVQLSWSVADADSLRVESDQPDAPGDVTGNMVEVDVQADTTFTLIANNEGGRSEESLVVEVNSIGEPDILVQFGSTEADRAMDLAVQSDGSLYVVGSTQGDMDGENSGRGDAFIAKFSASGARSWTRQISSEEGTSAQSVAVADDGSVYIAARISGNSDNPRCLLARYFDDGDLDWLREIDDDTGGGCAVAVYGSTPYLCSAEIDTHITAFSSANEPGWSRTVEFGSSSVESIADCVADAGGVYAVGYSTGTFGGGPGRGMGFSHEGVKLWSLEWSGIDYRSTVGATSFDGALYVVGSAEPDQDFLSTSAGSSDAIVARRSTSDGELLDGVQFGSSGGDSGEDVAVDLRGNILVVGSADSSLRSGQSGRHFVAKRTQDNEVWTRQFGPNDDSGGATAVVVAPNGTVVVVGTTSEELSPGAPGGGDAYLYIFK